MLKIIIITFFFVIASCNELSFEKIKNIVKNLNTKYFDPINNLWNCKNFGCDWWQSAWTLYIMNDFIHISYLLKKNDSYTNELVNITKFIYNSFSVEHECDSCNGDIQNVSFFIQCNGYYDDEAWWALAWMRAYQVSQYTKSIPEYLDLSKKITLHLKQGWNNDCNGGIPWRHCGKDKMTIQNSIYLNVLNGLYKLTNNSEYYLDMKKSLKWLMNSNIVRNNYIYDGLNESCINNCVPGYTYNQGLLLPILKNMNYDTLALGIAHNVLGFDENKNYVWHNRILREYDCVINGSCNDDQKMFKGIFMSFLKDYNLMEKSKRITDFINNNSISIISILNDKNNMSLIWTSNVTGYDNPVDFRTEISATSCLISSLWNN